LIKAMTRLILVASQPDLSPQGRVPPAAHKAALASIGDLAISLIARFSFGNDKQKRLAANQAFLKRSGRD
jgi:hypothetical protein